MAPARHEAAILLKRTHAEDGPTELGAQGSNNVDGAYWSGPYRVWIKVGNPGSIAGHPERAENWPR